MNKAIKKILVIDDDPDVLQAVQFILDSEGYTSEGTTKGEEAYEKIAQYKPDLVILDVLLSGNDGRIICKNIKNEEKTKKIPVIMISAHPSAKESVKSCGANSFVAKPFSINELLDEIKMFIG